MEERKVIGQGTYGCVIKPTLSCKRKPKNLSYKNKVSKLMTTRHAKKEIAEYKQVQRADPNNVFYLGKPDLCNVAEIDTNKSVIPSCKIGKDALANLAEYKLIVMEDGGPNLEQYVKTMKKWKMSAEHTEKCERFLLEALRLFRGLILFKQHGLIHHDLKPHNFVYNEGQNRLNFIDFGMMKSKTKVEKSASRSTYSYGSKVHWSWPWEIEYLNKSRFVKYSKATNDERVRKMQRIKEEFETGDKSPLRTFFYYTLNRALAISDYKEECNVFFQDYEDFLFDDMKTMKYEDFLEKCIDTIDSYGLGFTMLHWLHVAKKHLDKMLVVRLDELFNMMICARLNNRLTIENSIELFERIITDEGLLEKYGKMIVDDMIVDYSSKLEAQETVVEVDEKFQRNPAIADIDLGEQPAKPKKNLGKECPPGKERNPNTGRCIKTCKKDYVRNVDFKCVKNKTRREK